MSERDKHGRFIKGHRSLINDRWSAEDVEYLKQHYSNTPSNREIAITLNKQISASAIGKKANSLGLRKTAFRSGFKYVSKLRGLTYEQIHGVENASLLKQKLSKINLNRPLAIKEQISRKKSLKTKGTRTGNNNPATRPEVRDKIALALKNGASSFYQFKNHPEWRKKNLKSCMKKPSGLEKTLLSIITKYNYPFRYTGNGELIIGSLNPDFAHINDRKVIEVFGRAFHDPDITFKSVIPWHQQYFGRMAYFAQMGYKCLILWDKELKNEDAVVSKIQSFLESA